MKLFRLLLFPFSLLYGLVVILRNFAYDKGILKSESFDLPVISVGNLTAGGSGKTPMTEYLVRLFKNQYKIATLSRGYGRETSGFLFVNEEDASSETGDEPLQFKRKFRDITVAVCENRVEGISRLKKDHDLIILDDAFQHRAVKPGFSILLFDYTSMFKVQLLLPAGDLREPLSGRSRSDVIVVTKTPRQLPDEERKKIIKSIRPREGQPVFFSYLNYGDMKPLGRELPGRPVNSIQKNTEIILITGIANAGPLLSELLMHTAHVTHHAYADHHKFSKKNICKLVQSFNKMQGNDRLILTTEKDAQRLSSGKIKKLLNGLPVYYLPVEAEIHEPQKAEFDKLAERYAAELTLNNGIYKA